jgi:hypothetical protein
MSRVRSAIVVAVIGGCATSAAIPAGGPTGGSGGAGGTLGVGSTTATGSGGAPGTGGAGDLGGGPPDAAIDVDATACAAYVETFMPACNACLDVGCCDVAAACFAVPDCFGYASCQQNCPAPPPDGGSNTCLDGCTMSYPMAGSAFTALTTCLHGSCAGVCPY